MIGKLLSNLPAKTTALAIMRRRVEESGDIVATTRPVDRRARGSRLAKIAPQRDEFLPPQPDDRRPIEAA